MNICVRAVRGHTRAGVVDGECLGPGVGSRHAPKGYDPAMPPTTPPTTMTRGARARRALLFGGGALLLLYLMPFGRLLLWPLVLLSTLAHEAGHGIAALTVGGEFTSLSIFLDASGVAMHRGVTEPARLALVATGGLLGPSVVAAGLFVAARSARGARAALAMLGLTCGALVVLVVENMFGVVFVAFTSIALVALAVRASVTLAQSALVFLALTLALSVFSRADYLFAREAETGAGTLPSDTMQVALALGGPHFVWALLIGAFSLAVLVVGALTFASRVDDA